MESARTQEATSARKSAHAQEATHVQEAARARKSVRAQEIASLVSMLDDLDDSIMPLITEKLRALKPDSSTLLAISSTYQGNTILHNRLSRLISELQKDELERDFDAWQNERDPELLKGLWLVNRALFPHLAYDILEHLCMDMAKDVWVELTDNKTAVEKVHLYNHVFYHRIGFRIDLSLSELEYALLDVALDKRQANPILFGLIYLDVAFRSGLPIRAMAFSGGFLPVCVDENERFLFYINIYNNGEIFGKEQLAAFLSDYGLSIPYEHFTLCNVFTLVGIYAESLYLIAGNMGNIEMEQKMESFLKLFGDQRFLITEEDE